MKAKFLTCSIIGTDHYHADLITDSLIHGTRNAIVKNILISGALANTIKSKYKSLVPQIMPRNERTIQAVLESDTDIVFLFTQNFEKPGLISRIMGSKKNIVVDKPIAISLKGLDLIERSYALNISKKLDKNPAFSVLFTSGFNPLRQELKQRLRQNIIGKIQHIEQSSQNLLDKGHPRSPHMFMDKKYGGVLVDMCSHSIDFILSLFKKWDYTVEDAMLRKHYPSPHFINQITRTKGKHSARMLFYDAGSVFFRINGISCQVSGTWLMPRQAPYESGRTVIYGKEGDIAIGKGKGGKTTVLWTPYKDKSLDGINFKKGRTVELKIKPVKGYGYSSYLKAYINSIKNRRLDSRLPTYSRIMEGSRLLLLANEKARKGI